MTSLIRSLFNLVVNPHRIQGAIRREAITHALKINQFFYRRKGIEGIDMMEADWDFLILLDGCRADLMTDKAFPDWEVHTRKSPASSSHGFIESTFMGRDLTDTVYVTANPHFEDFDLDFHYVENLLVSAWDEDLHTVRPADAVKAAREVAEEFRTNA